MKINCQSKIRECHLGCGHNLSHRRAGLPQHGAKALLTELAV